jgi:hypothetical protein
LPLSSIIGGFLADCFLAARDLSIVHCGEDCAGRV